MKTILKRSTEVAFFFGITAAILGYGYHSFQGANGWFSLVRANHQAHSLQLQIDALEANNNTLENLTSRLSRSNLDLDLLDERARIVLGYVNPNDILLVNSK